MRIGIDVGGTNTGAVLMDGPELLAKVKTPTTTDVTSGIVAAIKSILADAEADRAGITAVMIGTTHFTNAVVQRRHIAKIAAVRIGLPAAATLPPFVDWPADLRALAQGPTFMIRGGHELDGLPIAPFDRAATRSESGCRAAEGEGGSHTGGHACKPPHGHARMARRRGADDAYHPAHGLDERRADAQSIEGAGKAARHDTDQPRRVQGKSADVQVRSVGGRH